MSPSRDARNRAVSSPAPLVRSPRHMYQIIKLVGEFCPQIITAIMFMTWHRDKMDPNSSIHEKFKKSHPHIPRLASATRGAGKNRDRTHGTQGRTRAHGSQTYEPHNHPTLPTHNPHRTTARRPKHRARAPRIHGIHTSNQKRPQRARAQAPRAVHVYM